MKVEESRELISANSLTQHGFCEHSEKSDCFHEPIDRQHDVSNSGSDRPNNQHEAVNENY